MDHYSSHNIRVHTVHIQAEFKNIASYNIVTEKLTQHLEADTFELGFPPILLPLLFPSSPRLHHSGGRSKQSTRSPRVPVENLLPLWPQPALSLLLPVSQQMVEAGRTLLQPDWGCGQPTAVKGRLTELGEVSGELEEESREK